MVLKDNVHDNLNEKDHSLLDKNALIQKFIHNSRSIKTLTSNYKEQIKNIKILKELEIDKLRDKVYKLNSKMSNIEYNSSKQINDLEKELYSKCKERYIHIEEVDTILKLLRIDTTQKLIWEVNTHKDKYIEEIDTFFESKTMILKSYLYDSDRRNKVNKYSLGIVGKTILKDKCKIEFPQEYISLLIHYANVTKFVKKLPTLEALKRYYIRNKDNILKNFIHEYKRFESYYFKVIKKYTLEDFLPLAKAKCSSCGYFIIRFDSYNYYLNKNECPKCHEHTYFKINIR